MLYQTVILQKLKCEQSFFLLMHISHHRGRPLLLITLIICMNLLQFTTKNKNKSWSVQPIAVHVHKSGLHAIHHQDCQIIRLHNLL